MAIVLEDEKKGVSLVTVLSIIVVVGIVFFGAYYLFFTKPELIEVVVPQSLQNVQGISHLTFDPKTAFDSDSGEKSSQVFRTLRKFGEALPLPTPGRTNPFKAF